MASKIVNDAKKWFGIVVDAILTGINFIAEKTGYGIKFARMYREKSRLQENISAEFLALGIVVHRKIATEKLADISKKLEVQDMLQKITQKQSDFTNISKKIDAELKEMKEKSKALGTKIKSKTPIKIDSSKKEEAEEAVNA